MEVLLIEVRFTPRAGYYKLDFYAMSKTKDPYYTVEVTYQVEKKVKIFLHKDENVDNPKVVERFFKKSLNKDFRDKVEFLDYEITESP